MEVNAVITGDLVKSRKIKDADVNSVISNLKETFNEINNKLLSKKGQFEMFRGDSFQIIVPTPELALLVSIIIRAHLRIYEPSISTTDKNKNKKPILYAYSDARVSIGIGSISYNANKITESQGEAFQKSGHALDLLKKNNERLSIVTPWEDINHELEVECKLADVLISRWTAATAEAIYYHLLYGKNQKELATLLKITQPGIHKRMVVYGNINTIQAFINRYQELISKAK